MDKLTQSNAAGAEESASASEELNAQANELRHAVGVLARLVGGSGEQGQASSPAHDDAIPMHTHRRAAAPVRLPARQGAARSGAFHQQ